MEQEILKFTSEHTTSTNFKLARVLIRMQCEAPLHATYNVVGVGGLLRGKGALLLRKLATACRA